MSNQDQAEQLRSKMSALRQDLRTDVANVSESAKAMADWRYYFQRFPWAAAGIAAAAGYMVVPKRTQIVSPEPDALKKLAKDNKLVVKRKPKATSGQSLANTLLTLVATAATRAAVGYVGGKLATVADPRSNANSQAASDSHESSGGGATRRPSPR